MNAARILVRKVDATVQVRVVGRATFACSYPLQEFLLKELEDESASFFFELSECVFMDSTFMGLLAMVALRCRGGAAVVSLANTGDRVMGLLSGLGLQDLFTFCRTPDAGPAQDRPLAGEKPLVQTPDERGTRRTMLDAHEALGQVDPENVQRFRDVIEFLKDEVKEGG